MQKQALTIDPSVVGRYAVGGALTGGSIAALVNLVHMINKLREERAKALKPVETDENTIVLSLPKKAEVEAKQPTKVQKVEGPSSGDFSLNKGPAPGQSRGLKGQFGPKLCVASFEKDARGTSGWPTLTASVLAAIASGAGGAALINKLYEMQRERKLKEELTAAKQEYMDMLSGRVKGASFVDQLFEVPLPLEKEADSTFGVLNYPMAALVLLTLLGGGATDYLTKRILDEKFRETKEKSLDVPKVKRIVFRSTPEPVVAKQATAEEANSVLAALFVTMDKVAGSYRFTGHPDIQDILKERGTSKEQLVKEADDYDVIRSHLEDPVLADAIIRVAKPGFFTRLATRIPGIRNIARRRLMAMFDQFRVGQMNPYQMNPYKTAQDLTEVAPAVSPLTNIGASLFGGTVAKQLFDKNLTPEELAQLIVAAQEQAAENKQRKDTKVPDKVQVGAADPKAQEYIAKNRKKIEAIIKRLAAEGQI